MLIMLELDRPVLDMILGGDSWSSVQLWRIFDHCGSTVDASGAQSGLRGACNHGANTRELAATWSNTLVQHECVRCVEAATASSGTDRDVLARGKCLQALAALRHTKWFQVCVSLIQSFVASASATLLLSVLFYTVYGTCAIHVAHGVSVFTVCCL